jgi:hypothetical protein
MAPWGAKLEKKNGSILTFKFTTWKNSDYVFTILHNTIEGIYKALLIWEED